MRLAADETLQAIERLDATLDREAEDAGADAAVVAGGDEAASPPQA